MYQHKKERISDFEQLFFGERWHTAHTGAKINLKHNPISLTFQERNRFRVTEKALKKQKKSTIKSSGIMQSREVWIEKQKAFTKPHITSSVLITHSWITLWLVDSNSLLCMPNAYLIPSYSSLCTKASFISGCGFIISHRIPPEAKTMRKLQQRKKTSLRSSHRLVSEPEANVLLLFYYHFQFCCRKKGMNSLIHRKQKRGHRFPIRGCFFSPSQGTLDLEEKHTLDLHAVHIGHHSSSE